MGYVDDLALWACQECGSTVTGFLNPEPPEPATDHTAGLTGVAMARAVLHASRGGAPIRKPSTHVPRRTA